MKEKEIIAIGRLNNNFIYSTEIFEYDPSVRMSEVDHHLNKMAGKGWKLHTIDRIEPGVYFCVWEKLDYEQ